MKFHLHLDFRTRILLALILVGVAPLVLASALAYRANRDEVLGAVGRSQAQSAQDLARECEQFVLGAVDHLSASAGYLPLAQLGPDQVRDVLGIPFRQLRWVNTLVLLSERGTAVGAPLFEPAPAEGGAPASQREPAAAEDLDAFSGSIPLATALASDVAIGQPYRGPRTGVPRLAVAVRVEGPPRRVLAAELSLRDLTARLEEIASGGDAVFLVDARGAIVATGAAGGALTRAERELAERGLATQQPSVRSIVRADGARWLAAFAPVGTVGWGVVVARPERIALHAVERARAYTLFWAAVALVLAVVMAYLLARDLTVPIRMLSDAAHALRAGRYHTPIPARGDELGEFALAFDHMAREVTRRDEEIRAWNAELERRVEDRTAALKAAQDQVLRARRLAAVGSLAAGISHEINNPLTAVIGLVSLVRKKLGAGNREAELLGSALEQATRVARVVEHLREISERQRECAGVRFALAVPVRSALEAHAPEFGRRHISIESRFDPGVPDVQGDPVQMQQLVDHLVANALDATPEGGSVRVHVSAVDGQAVRLSVTDTGSGIPAAVRERIFDPFFTSKTHGSLGLGLTLSNTIVDAHDGKLLVESSEGTGSTFTVLLPAAAARAHLE